MVISTTKRLIWETVCTKAKQLRLLIDIHKPDVLLCSNITIDNINILPGYCMASLLANFVSLGPSHSVAVFSFSFCPLQPGE